MAPTYDFHTGTRVSRDIDAAFSHRIALPDNLEVAYRDADGAARLLYFDHNYNDSLALMHEDAYDDSQPLALPGVDPGVLDGLKDYIARRKGQMPDANY